MESTLTTLRTGRNRVVEGWNKGHLIEVDYGGQGGSMGSVITVCLLGSLAPQAIIDKAFRTDELGFAIEADSTLVDTWTSAVDSYDYWIDKLGVQEFPWACSARECRAVEFLAKAIRELHPHYAVNVDEANRASYASTRQTMRQRFDREYRSFMYGWDSAKREAMFRHRNDEYASPTAPRWLMDHNLITSYNDRDETSHADVLQVFDFAIALAEGFERGMAGVKVREHELATAGD